MVKNPPADAGEVGSILESGRSPREGNGNPLQYSFFFSFTSFFSTPVFLPGRFHGQRSLAGYSLGSSKELDMAEHTHTHTHTHTPHTHTHTPLYTNYLCFGSGLSYTTRHMAQTSLILTLLKKWNQKVYSPKRIRIKTLCE